MLGPSLRNKKKREYPPWGLSMSFWQLKLTCVRNFKTFVIMGMFRLIGITSNFKHFRKDTCIYFRRVS